MAHAYFHARSSARRFGGLLDDYLAIHELMDHTKMHLADCRHRLLLHNSWGIFLVEKIAGKTLFRPSDGKIMPLRPVLEQHVIEDFGHIPTLEDCLCGLTSKPLLREDDDLLHCQQSAATFGGLWTDYQPVHQLLNSTREVLADGRHRRLLHNAWGITIILQILGETFSRPSDGETISLRPVLETHIMQDIGYIPTLQESVEGIVIEQWMYGQAQPLSKLNDLQGV